MSQAAGFDYSLVFDQNLRTTDIPVLEYSVKGEKPEVWWDNVVPGFKVPVLLRINVLELRVTVSEAPTGIELDAPLQSFELDRNFYMTVEAQ